MLNQTTTTHHKKFTSGEALPSSPSSPHLSANASSSKEQFADYFRNDHRFTEVPYYYYQPNHIPEHNESAAFTKINPKMSANTNYTSSIINKTSATSPITALQYHPATATDSNNRHRSHGILQYRAAPSFDDDYYDDENDSVHIIPSLRFFHQGGVEANVVHGNPFNGSLLSVSNNSTATTGKTVMLSQEDNNDNNNTKNADSLLTLLRGSSCATSSSESDLVSLDGCCHNLETTGDDLSFDSDIFMDDDDDNDELCTEDMMMTIMSDELEEFPVNGEIMDLNDDNMHLSIISALNSFNDLPPINAEQWLTVADLDQNVAEAEEMVILEQQQQEQAGPPPLPQQPQHEEFLQLDHSVIQTRLGPWMQKSLESQDALQRWDRMNGLPVSHAKTMVNTSRSRRQLMDDLILPKWDGSPLIPMEGLVIDVAADNNNNNKRS